MLSGACRVRPPTAGGFRIRFRNGANGGSQIIIFGGMIRVSRLIKIDRAILTGHYSACYLLVMDNKIKIGRRLVEMRKAAGLTQDELSEASGISQGHISHIERSGEISSIEHLRGLAAVFNIEPGTLLNQLLEK